MTFPRAITIDLLDSATYKELLAEPQRLADRIPSRHRDWIVIDEIQRVPDLLNEVHRLIENRKLRFVLTGSSARKLRRQGVNLLGGRALTLTLHPLTSGELGGDFDLKKAIRRGTLPMAYRSDAPERFLASYVVTYLREEVQQEGLARNLAAFTRFLESASFSQGAILNMSAIAADCSVERKAVEDYFLILEDLMIGIRLPVFSRRAKREMTKHPKFYFFDSGVFRAIRPRGPLDSAEEIDGPALETLVLNELRALNAYRHLGYQIHFWKPSGKLEVDFVLYGERGLHAIEVKRSSRVRPGDLTGLIAFLQDYPMAKARLLYGGSRRYFEKDIEVIPLEECFKELPAWL